MKLRFPLGLLACVMAGQAAATCGPIMQSPLYFSDKGLVVDYPVMDVAAPMWQADQVYQAGDMVLAQNGLYVARWWTQNEQPGPAWVSWQLITREYDNWQPSAVYELGDKVLFEGKIYQAQYWNQGESPSQLAAWLIDPITEQMQAAEFYRDSYDCGAPPQYNYDGSYYYTRYYANHLYLREELTDKVVFDHVKVHRNGVVTEQKIRAQVEGEVCEGQAECNALLAGQLKQVKYGSLSSKSSSITYGTIKPTPAPVMPLEQPNSESVVSRAFMPIIGPSVEPSISPSDFVLVCNQDEVCRKVGH